VFRLLVSCMEHAAPREPSDPEGLSAWNTLVYAAAGGDPMDVVSWYMKTDLDDELADFAGYFVIVDRIGRLWEEADDLPRAALWYQKEKRYDDVFRCMEKMNTDQKVMGIIKKNKIAGCDAACEVLRKSLEKAKAETVEKRRRGADDGSAAETGAATDAAEPGWTVDAAAVGGAAGSTDAAGFLTGDRPPETSV
jgi:hypothetical protein